MGWNLKVNFKTCHNPNLCEVSKVKPKILEPGNKIFSDKEQERSLFCPGIYFSEFNYGKRLTLFRPFVTRPKRIKQSPYYVDLEHVRGYLCYGVDVIALQSAVTSPTKFTCYIFNSL